MADLKTPVGDAPVLPLILMGAGGLILWFGVHYWRDATVKSPATVLKSTLQGKGIPAKSASPTVQADLTAAITSGGAAQAAAGSSGGGGTAGGEPAGKGGDLAALAEAHVGHAYLYGGAPGRNGQNPWDCSSMDHYV